MGVALTDSENSGSGATSTTTMIRKLIILTQRHRRPLTITLYVLLLSVLAVFAVMPSYLDAVLGPLFGSGDRAADSDAEQASFDVPAPTTTPAPVVKKLFDLPFVPQRDFLCDEMHIKVQESV